MVFLEEEKAKTWNIEKQEFVFFKNKMDLLELERQRYLISQINQIEQRIEKINAYFSRNVPLEESDFIMKRLEELERKAKVFSVEPELFNLYIQDVFKKQNEMNALMENYVSVSQMQGTLQSLSSVIALFGIMTGSKMKGLLTDVLQKIENIQKRIQNIDETTKRMDYRSMKKIVEKIKVDINEENLV